LSKGRKKSEKYQKKIRKNSALLYDPGCKNRITINALSPEICAK
jgi:hypothetical protein